MSELCSLLIVSPLFQLRIQTKFSATVLEGEMMKSLKFCKKQTKVMYFHPLSHNRIAYSTHTFLLRTCTPEMGLIFHNI